MALSRRTCLPRRHTLALLRESLAALLLGSLAVLMAGCLLVGESRAEPAAEQAPHADAAAPTGAMEATVIPIVTYAPETRLGLGVGTWFIAGKDPARPQGKPDNIWLSAQYTQQAQTIVWIIPELFFRQDRYRLLIDLKYLKFPTKFFGIGNDTREEAEEDYTPITRQARVAFTGKIFEAVSLGAVAEFDRTEIDEVEPGGLLDTTAVPGRQGSTIAGIGPLLRRDTRDHHFDPRQGSLQELSVVRFGEALGSDFDFTRSALDLRWYFPLFASHVLSLQALFKATSGEAPFNTLPNLGGRFLFRGLFEGRFRDNALLALQVEYRLPLGGRWGVAAFLAHGDVAESAGDFEPNEFKTAAGAGLRYAYNQRERINLRLDVAAAKESTGVYFSVGEAF